MPPRLTFGRTLMFFVRFAVCVNRCWSPRPAPLRCAIVLPPFILCFYCIIKTPGCQSGVCFYLCENFRFVNSVKVYRFYISSLCYFFCSATCAGGRQKRPPRYFDKLLDKNTSKDAESYFKAHSDELREVRSKRRRNAVLSLANLERSTSVPYSTYLEIQKEKDKQKQKWREPIKNQSGI